MDWIASLLGALCPFCREPLGNARRACDDCAPRLALLERKPVVARALDGGLELRAALYYNEPWVRGLILRQKSQRTRPAVEWLARLLWHRIPPEWRALPLAWIPGRVFSDLHLIEAVALELARLGQPLVERQLLVRKLWSGKPQKALSEHERRARDMRNVYGVPRSPGTRRREGAVILLDDVVTTGATVEGCGDLLMEKLGVDVVGALALAYTLK